MSSIKISMLKDPKSDQVIELLARAYLTNPINVSALGGSGEKERQMNRDLFRVGTELVFRGEWYAAFDSRRIVGVLHTVRFPRCRLSDDQHVAIGPRLEESLREAAPRVAEWLGEWAKRDPDIDHWHLGPVAVRSELQKRGIGRLMMEQFCTRVDESGAHAYLETDRPENVSFYEKSGFVLTDQALVLGIPSYFMTRTARAVS